MIKILIKLLTITEYSDFIPLLEYIVEYIELMIAMKKRK